MKKITLLKAAPLVAVLLGSVLFMAESSSSAKADAVVPDTMATEFLWTPAGIAPIADKVDTMAADFLWVPARSTRK